jgi:uncharacterized caspase-like protein
LASLVLIPSIVLERALAVKRHLLLTVLFITCTWCLGIVGPALGQVAGQAGKYALLVAVHEYDDAALGRVPYARDDILMLAKVLKDASYNQVVVLTPDRSDGGILPDADKIRHALKTMLRLVDRKDTVLVAFAGQCADFDTTEDQFFCPMNARLADKSTLLSLTEISRELERCAAATKLLLVDGYRLEPKVKSSTEKTETAKSEATAVEPVKTPAAKPVVADKVVVPQSQSKLRPGKAGALFSCSDGQTAYDHPNGKHSVFFQFVLEGLRGDAHRNRNGLVEFTELGEFIRGRVPSFVRSEFDQKQVPQEVSQSRDPMTVVSLSPSEGGGTKLALLVGVNNYEQLPACPGAENDMTELAEILGKAGYRPEDITILTQSRGVDDALSMPKADRINRELRKLLRGRLKGDSVLVAFSGQGAHYPGTPDSFFCPADAKLSDPKTLISLNEVYGDLDRCHATSKILLVNASRRDPRQAVPTPRQTAAIPRSTHARTPVANTSLKLTTPAVFSWTHGERAGDDPDRRHSAFYYCVIRGLQGEADLNKDGVVTVLELQHYLRVRVPEYRGATGNDQHPVVIGSPPGPSPLIGNANPAKRSRGLVDQ